MFAHAYRLCPVLLTGLGHHLFTCAFGVNKRPHRGFTPMHILPVSTIALLPAL